MFRALFFVTRDVVFVPPDYDLCVDIGQGVNCCAGDADGRVGLRRRTRRAAWSFPEGVAVCLPEGQAAGSGEQGVERDNPR